MLFFFLTQKHQTITDVKIEYPDVIALPGEEVHLHSL